MRRHAVVIIVLAALGLQSCLSTNLAKIGSESTFAAEEDERQLWLAARAAEEKVLPAPAEYREPALESYLNGLVTRLLPPGYTQAGGPPIKVRVRRDPRLNAMAMPHGTIIVHTGVIARAENEAQLAGVLGHELTHITHRHSVRDARAIRNRENAINAAAILGTLALAVAAADQANRGNYAAAQALANVAPPVLDFGLRLTYTAMVNGYSRDLEREADAEGLRLMADSGYDPREMKAFFYTLLRESNDRGRIETFFYGSHPRTVERIENVDRVAGSLQIVSPNALDATGFGRQTGAVRLLNAQYDANLGRLSVAKSQMSRVLQGMPESARSRGIDRYLDGLLYASASFGSAKRSDIGAARTQIAAAETAYNRAIAAAGATSAAAGNVHRALGYLYAGHRELISRDCDAKAAFERYLSLQPNAADRQLIQAKIADLRC